MEIQNERVKGCRAIMAGWLTIFWPGVFIVSFPGVLGRHRQEAFKSVAPLKATCRGEPRAAIGIQS